MNHPLIWGSRYTPNKQEIDLQLLCSWGSARWSDCQESIPFFSTPLGHQCHLSSVLSLMLTDLPSSLSQEILSLNHLLCAQEPPSITSINLVLTTNLWTEQHFFFCLFILFYNFFYWCIVDLQYYVSFSYTAQWFSYTHIFFFIYHSLSFDSVI